MHHGISSSFAKVLLNQFSVWDARLHVLKYVEGKYYIIIAEDVVYLLKKFPYLGVRWLRQKNARLPNKYNCGYKNDRKQV